MTQFQTAILHVVRSVPPGRVVSYGQVAAYVGTPTAARQVGWAMHSMEGIPDFPWWRVLNNKGSITIKGSFTNTAQLQKELLELEGIPVNSEYTLNIKKYRYRPSEDVLNSLRLDKDYIYRVLHKFDIV